MLHASYTPWQCFDTSFRFTFGSLVDETVFLVQDLDDVFPWSFSDLKGLPGDLLGNVRVNFRNVQQLVLRQHIVGCELFSLFHSVLVRQDVGLWKMAQQHLAESLLRIFNNLALVTILWSIPNTRGIGRTNLVHVDELLLPGVISDIAEFELRVDKYLIHRSQSFADHSEAFFQKLFVKVHVLGAFEIERLQVPINARPRDVNVVHLRHSRNTFQDAFGRWCDQEFLQLLIVFQTIGDLNAAKLPTAL